MCYFKKSECEIKIIYCIIKYDMALPFDNISLLYQPIDLIPEYNKYTY